MNLATLKSRLSTITGTTIKSVIFDYDEYLNRTKDKNYPLVLWSLAGAEFTKDSRTNIIQKEKTTKLTVFVFNYCGPDTPDKITSWDMVEAAFDIYINNLNQLSDIKIKNIDAMNGKYIQSDKSADNEIGIMFQNVEIETFC